MRYKRLKLSTVLLIGLGLPSVQAQEAIPATGGEATGSGGTVSYTVGQVVYTTLDENTGSVAQGVQQAYTIELITDLEKDLEISLDAMVYPNPSTDYVKLQIDSQPSGEMSYRLYSQNGILMDSKDISHTETRIAMDDLGPATYFLRVMDGRKEIKNFKIIKQ